jgi:hypothetical protein
LESDRGLPEEQQTVFHMKPKTGHDANQQTKFYLRAYREKDGGNRDLDVTEADKADILNFQNVCRKIENFAFPESYYETHPQIKKEAKPVKIVEDGKEIEVLFTPVIEDRSQIADVFRHLDAASIRELTEVANSISKLKEGQKK